ncbi:MAG: helix-turn-helix domain-containing protein [Actinomycetota bacterium]|nr:helix-turn-helix domain-containing protein [Actinomycetota bacterium]
MKNQAQTDEPITVALKPLMRERQLTFRALAELTQHHDAGQRGVTYAYLCALTSGREYPSRRSLELIAASFGIEPGYFVEYRLAELRDQLDRRRAGFQAAWRRSLQLAG